MNLRSALAAAALALLAAPLAACASDERLAPLRQFEDGRYGASRAWYENALAAGGADEALDRNEAGTVALVQGDVEGAHRHFQEAFNAMEDLSSTTGETVTAMVGSESSKRWKGDPYERCMNAYYLGVTYWMKGDPDNAAACFKTGLLRDADSEKGAAQSDFALLWFLMGMAQREASHEDRGAAALARAHELQPANAAFDPARTADANVVVVVDVGLGPAKVPAGAHGSKLQFVRRPTLTDHADVLADGKPLGRASRSADVFAQAVTRGAKVLDNVNTGKAVLKDAAVIGGIFVLDNSGSGTSDAIGAGMILLGLLLPAETDVRCWRTLPGEVHVLTATLPPGEHDLVVQPALASGSPILEEGRSMHVTVRAGHTTFVWTRAAPAAVADPGEGRMSTP